jgi:sec-independent protein translocase protein TatC
VSQARNLKRRRLQFLRRRRRRPAVAAMTVVEHLSELRTRLIVSLAAFLLISIGAFFFYEPMLHFLLRPYCSLPRDVLPDALRGPGGCSLIIWKPLGAFLFRFKLTALAGIAVSSPIWLYEVYAFILPALTSKEKRYSIPFLLSSVALFAIGAGFAYLTLPTGLRFLIALGGSEIVPLIGAEEYLNFIGLMLLGFGVTFELPLVLIFLGLADIVTVDQLRSQRKAAIVFIAILAAVVTPSQDPYTMLVLGVPLYILYEVTLLVLWRLTRNRTRRPAEVR